MIFVGIAIVLPFAVIIPATGKVGWAGSLIPFFGLSVSGFCCFLLTRHITSPLFQLQKAAGSIAAGNLSVRVPVTAQNRSDEIGELARDFDQMAVRLESLVNSHKRLLGDVSHELRSPLARLLVALGLARKATAEEIPELLDRISLESQRLNVLIGQLLTLSRIESGSHTGTTSSIDLTALVHEVVNDADFEAKSQSRSVRVTASDECIVSGSEEMLRSAIENVVRNAVRYTTEGSSVDVSIRRERDCAVIRVRDFGPGVPDNMLSEIFLPFRRITSTHGKQHDGSGLGLAIAQRAVAANGGRIEATNAPDGGLIITIELPTHTVEFVVRRSDRE